MRSIAYVKGSSSKDHQLQRGRCNQLVQQCQSQRKDNVMRLEGEGFAGSMLAFYGRASSSQATAATASRPASEGGVPPGTADDVTVQQHHVHEGSSSNAVPASAASSSSSAEHHSTATQADPASTTRGFTCCGYRPPNAPHPLCKNLALEKLHGAGVASLDLINDTVKSKDCTTVAAEVGGSCTECAALQYNQPFNSIVLRGSQDPHLSSRNSDLSMQQMTDKANNLQREKVDLKQRIVRSLRTVMKMESKLSAHDRLVHAIARQNIPRARFLLLAQLKQGASIHRICDIIDKAAKGMTHAYGYTGDEHDLGRLMQLLGGSSLLHVANRLGLAPSSTTISRSGSRPMMLLNAHESPDEKCVEHNLRNIVGNNFFESVASDSSIIILKTDEVATDMRVRWDPYTDCVAGLVGSLSQDKKVEYYDRSFATYQHALRLQKLFQEGKLVLANEASVFALGASCKTNYA